LAKITSDVHTLCARHRWQNWKNFKWSDNCHWKFVTRDEIRYEEWSGL